MEKKIPMRTCIGCRNVRPKNEMIRIVRTKDGLVEPDITGKAEGRGAYVCKNAECFLKLKGFEQDIQNIGFGRNL